MTRNRKSGPGNVLILARGGKTLRGTEVCAIAAGRAFAAAGHRIYMARNSEAMDGDLAPVAERIIPFELPEIMLEGTRSRLPAFRFTSAFRRLGRLVDELEIDVIYASGGHPCQLGVPVARTRGIPLLCHFHHPAPRRYYYLWLVRMADRVVFPSEYTRQHSLTKGGVDGVVVPNGIDVDRLRPTSERDRSFRARLGIPEDAVVIGQVGKLVPHKRADYLLDVFAAIAPAHPDLHLCLVGDGPILRGLDERRDQLGLGRRVTLTGYVDDVRPYYQNVIDINVCVSREEGLGLSILEGGACGLPSIASKAGGLKETLIEGRTGYFVEVEDSETLTGHLLRLAADPGLRNELGRGAREFVERKFAAADYGRRMVEELHTALDGG